MMLMKRCWQWLVTARFEIATIAGLVALCSCAALQLLRGEGVPASLSKALPWIAWAVSLTTVLHVYAVLMEVFMAHYSGVVVDGRKVHRTVYRKALGAALLQLPAASVCIPPVRENAWAVLGVSVLAFAGLVWQARLTLEFEESPPPADSPGI